MDPRSEIVYEVDRWISRATTCLLSQYRIQQRGCIQTPIIVEFDGSYQQLTSVAHFVKSNDALKKNEHHGLVCRILDYFVEHFTQYNFCHISCVVFDGIFTLINVLRLNDQFGTGSICCVDNARKNYVWSPDSKGMGMVIDCQALRDAYCAELRSKQGPAGVNMVPVAIVLGILASCTIAVIHYKFYLKE